MALDARQRASIYNKLVPLLGEDDANAFMSEFPSVEADELVTKQFLRAELRTEMHDQIGGLRTELHEQIGRLRTELHGEVGSLRTEMVDRFHQQTVWLGGAIAAATGVLAALTTLT